MDLVQPQWDMRSDLPNLNKTLKRSFADTEYIKKSIGLPKKGRCTVCSRDYGRPQTDRLAKNFLGALKQHSVWSVQHAFLILIRSIQYFVRGGTVGDRSHVSSKHLSSLIFRSTVFDSSGVKKGLRCSCKMHVWVSGPPKTPTAVDIRRSDVTVFARNFVPYITMAIQWKLGEILTSESDAKLASLSVTEFDNLKVLTANHIWRPHVYFRKSLKKSIAARYLT
ncbi:hypothetical protein TNCV_1312411 [Trichonephila clavipes]|nr:hypothetical protein TNCV_1312411 [Trichonephila clavipes]